jgi:hypothetical protein
MQFFDGHGMIGICLHRMQLVLFQEVKITSALSKRPVLDCDLIFHAMDLPSYRLLPVSTNDTCCCSIDANVDQRYGFGCCTTTGQFLYYFLRASITIEKPNAEKVSGMTYATHLDRCKINSRRKY